MIILTADIGSTYTKLTAIDTVNKCIIATSSAFTTIETDVSEGLENAYSKLKEKIGNFSYDKLLCCSSAAGGLKMVALGLVPELTSKAAKLAAASAGAKVVKTYAFELSNSEQEEIQKINPDLVLLCGGTDGGNKDVIITNAKRLSEIKGSFRVIVAGNKSASHELDIIFRTSGKPFVITENVMPDFNQLNIEPAKKKIKELFIKHIVEAKGLSKIQKKCSGDIIPTPLAVLNACELISKGYKNEAGIGDIMAVDIGGATTDIYSIAEGKAARDNIIMKGLPEPVNKRTVEGDLGMRYSLSSLAEELNKEGIQKETGIDKKEIDNWVNRCINNPNLLAKTNSSEQKIEEAIARNAVRIGVERHVGRYQSVYTPFGQVFTLTGKDLSEIPSIIGIGGVIINSKKPANILKGSVYKTGDPIYTKPLKPKYYIDKKYIFSSMGLLSKANPELALSILKKEIVQISI